MTVMTDMAAVAAECLKKPGTTSVWSARLGKYICSKDPRFPEVVEESGSTSHPIINPTFKLVFLTAFGGTVLFVAICVTVTIIAGKDMPGPLDKLITGLFDLAKIGFGAVVGLLGGQTMRAEYKKGQWH